MVVRLRTAMCLFADATVGNESDWGQAILQHDIDVMMIAMFV